ncbi:MAG: phosphoribosyltransferase [Legionellales bacterium]|nr:phosphoribosyltransferase [Legionellales bacterium]
MRFANREQAGQQLAQCLQAYRRQEATYVLALPRGGVPVAATIARVLTLPLDLCCVGKLGVPGYEELAMGAIASNGAQFLNQAIIKQMGITPEQIDGVMAEQQMILHQRERAYRGDRPYPILTDQQVILVDDGIATGATMQAAILSLQQWQVANVIVAVPVAPVGIMAEFNAWADHVYCVIESEMFSSVGQYYTAFPQLSDQQVIELLQPFFINSTP